MRVGIPKEIKSNENRVAITPAGVMAFVSEGHEIFIESGAGEGSGFSDERYEEFGATTVETAAEVYEKARLIVKVKEPLPQEYGHYRSDHLLFTYLHLAAQPELTEMLQKKGINSIAYETVQEDDGSLPLLTPMSEVAGKMATQMGAQFLERHEGGRGVLLGGVPGVSPAEVVVIGGGAVGTNAAKVAHGMGARVTVLDIDADRLRYLDDVFSGQLTTLMSNEFNRAQAVKEADILVGAVLIPGAKAPNLVTAEMVKSMKEGSVIVDVAIDQGGSVETIDRVTTHADPVYERHGVVHYSVANMPGAVPRTSTFALTNVTIPYGVLIANKGFEEAVTDHVELARGVNTCRGHVTHQAVAEAHGLDFTPLKEVLV